MKLIACKNYNIRNLLSGSLRFIKISCLLILLRSPDVAASNNLSVEHGANVLFQIRTVFGKVSDEKGNPLIGVTVSIRNSRINTVTDTSGNYKLDIPAAIINPVLIVSYVGYERRELRIGNNSRLNIQMKVLGDLMAETVVIGYGGRQNKLEQTGSISKINNSDFKTASINTVDQALQGRVPGVNVVQQTGEPGSAINVNIRGTTSISGDNQPLYVIDGFPVAQYADAPIANATGSNSGNGLFGLNPDDIENIEILKDASASAIYGSRAANGVVLITTKQGKAGVTKLELNNKSGVSIISNHISMMNSSEYVSIKNEQALMANESAPFNVDDFKNRPSTDWLDAITRTGFRQEVGLNIQGGSLNTNYFISGSYLNEKGLVLNSGNKRGSIRLNLNTNVKKWYDIRVQLAATRQNTAIGITQSRAWPSGGGPILNALRAAPVFRNEPDIESQTDIIDGVALAGATNPFINPVIQLTEKTDNRFSDMLMANFDNIFNLNKTKSLKLHVVVGSTLNNIQRSFLLPPLINPNNGGTALKSNAKVQSYNTAGYFTHNKRIGLLTMDNTLGTEFTREMSESTIAYSASLDFPDIALDNLGSGNTQTVGSNKSESLLASAFYRGNFNWNNRYIFYTSLRLDGSSRFADNKKSGFFPSFGIAWNISEEDFFKDNLSLVNLAKFRASYGSVGNDRSLPSYRSRRAYSTVFYENGLSGGAIPSVVLAINRPDNPNLIWESTNQFNIATELAFGQNRFGLTLEYYNKITKNLLQNSPVPSQSGYSSIWSNTGTIRNRGLELTLDYKVIRKRNLTWTSSLNLSTNKTILIDLGTFDPYSQGLSTLGGNLLGGNANVLIPGEELGLFYGYMVDGLYQLSDFNPDGSAKDGVPVIRSSQPNTSPGRLKFANTNKSQDNLVTEEDREIIGHAQPDLVLGFSNNINIKRFNINFLITGVWGNDILNVTSGYIRSGNLAFAGVSFNQTEEWYKKRWTLDNMHNDSRYPTFQTVAGIPTTDINSTLIEDGSYVRLKNVTIAYNFNIKKNGFINSLKAFFTGTDLLTISKYTGFDPEVSTYGSNPLQTGIDYGAYPRYRNYTLGITIQL